MLHRITREPALVVGVLTALFGLLVVFGVDLSADQIGAVVAFAGAVMALVRFLTTPSSEVAAQVKPSGQVVAGPSSSAPTGSELAPDAGGIVAVPVDPDAP